MAKDMSALEGYFDVIVVGAGNAALTAALAAHEAGATVLVLEKAPREMRGGNTWFSGGLFRFAYEGIEDVKLLMPRLSEEELTNLDVGRYSAQDYCDDIMRITHGEADPELTRITGERSLETMQWLTGHGLEWEFTPLWAVTRGARTTFTPGSLLQAKGKGVGLSAMLFRAVEGRGIPVWYETKFLKPLLNGRGGICGVSLRSPQGDWDVGCGAVVLACGGFEASPEMRARYLGGAWGRVKVRGAKYDTGEGLEAALAMGAKPAGHWQGCHATPIDAAAPATGDLKLTDRTNRLSYLFGIMVNVHGRRFVDEGEDFGQYTYAKTGAAILGQPRALAHQIFDQKTVGLLEKRYETGTPVSANTIEELARALGIDSGVLAGTVSEFNAAVQEGEFSPGVRDGKGTRGLEPPKSNWAVPLDRPPYVAYAVTCGITFTFGGLEITSRGQVLDTEDRPIPGLYAAGEITGKFFYHNYAGGAGLMRGAVFGRLAGAAAAAEGRARV